MRIGKSIQNLNLWSHNIILLINLMKKELKKDFFSQVMVWHSMEHTCEYNKSTAKCVSANCLLVI